MATSENPRRTRPADAVFSNWRAPDGWPCRRMDWPAPEGSKLRGSLLFAGGRGDFIEKYLEAYAHWRDSGWNVTAFDWRGQGLSRGGIEGGNLTSFDPLVADLAALIAEWRSATPGPHVAVGHSMGGHLLLRTLIERRPELDAAVLVAPMIRVNSAPLSPLLAPWITDWMCLVGRRDQRVFETPPGLAEPGGRRQRILTGSVERYEDELHWWAQEPGINLGGVSWGWMRAAYRSSATFTRERLRSVGLPVFLIGTDRDRLVSAAAIREAAGILPRAKLHMYADARHEILREADPVRLDALARIDAFLDEAAP